MVCVYSVEVYFGYVYDYSHHSVFNVKINPQKFYFCDHLLTLMFQTRTV